MADGPFKAHSGRDAASCSDLCSVVAAQLNDDFGADVSPDQLRRFFSEYGSAAGQLISSAYSSRTIRDVVFAKIHK